MSRNDCDDRAYGMKGGKYCGLYLCGWIEGYVDPEKREIARKRLLENIPDSLKIK